MRNEPLGFLSSMEHVAQPMYVLKPTCCFCRKWCGSDDAHTNKGWESPLRCKWSTPRLVSTMQLQVNRCLAMQLFFFFWEKKKTVTSRALADHCPRERKTRFFKAHRNEPRHAGALHRDAPRKQDRSIPPTVFACAVLSWTSHPWISTSLLWTLFHAALREHESARSIASWYLSLKILKHLLL